MDTPVIPLWSALKALVRSYEGPEVVDRPKPLVPKGWLLVKVCEALATGFEFCVAAGFIWAPSARVLGSSGFYGKVVEAGVDADRSLIGRYVALKCFKPRTYGVMGVDYDGCLAEYVAVPEDLVEPLPAGKEDHCGASAKALLRVAGYVVERAKGLRLVIAGAGFVGVHAALNAVEEASMVCVATRRKDLKRELEKAGVKVVKPDKLEGKYDVVFISSASAYMLLRTVEAVHPDLILLHPFAERIPVKPIPKDCRVELVDPCDSRVREVPLKKSFVELKESLADALFFSKLGSIVRIAGP